MGRHIRERTPPDDPSPEQPRTTDNGAGMTPQPNELGGFDAYRTPEPQRPTYGPHTWEVCERCNHGGHYCPCCGDDTTHAHPVCDDAMAG